MASWNVLSLNRAGALKELRSTLHRYSIAVAALQEIRWCGNNIMDFKDSTLFWSGGDRREFGTGFLVAKHIRQNVIDFIPVNKRLSALRLRGKFFNITIMSAHAPTEDKSEEEKDEFYDKMSSRMEWLWNRVPRHDTKVLLGDFNAKLGRENCFSSVIGRHSLHEDTNENGNRLIDFAMGKNMVISSTCFPHKNIHKATWKSPDGETENQIDHVLIDKRHATDILDVRTCRGADVDSDHFMLRIKVRERLANCGKEKGTRHQLYDVHRLNSEEKLRGQFQSMLDEEIAKEQEELRSDDIEVNWKRIKTVLENSAKEVVGVKQREKRAEWFDKECEGIIKERNLTRMSYLQKRTRASFNEFKFKRKEAKKLLRTKKRIWETNRLKQIEEHYWKGESRYFFKGIREAKTGFVPRSSFCRSKEGKLIGGKDGILARWSEYFAELLNPSEEEMEREEQTTDSVDEEDLECPGSNEILEIIKKLKNFRSPGQDGMPAELFKNGSNKFKEELVFFLQELWKKEVLPKDWGTSVLCPIYKKGDKTDCNNYRGIALLDVAYKIFAKMINKRLVESVELFLGDYQCGFRKNRSTIDQIFALRCILEKTYEYNIDIHQLFIDFKQAYDSIRRESLFRILKEMGIHPKLRRLIKLSLSNTSAQVKIQNSKSATFVIRKGLRQGDPLSTCLFNICLEYVMKRIKVNPGGTLFNRSCQYLAFADDLVLLARNQAALRESFLDLLNSSKEIGLEVNIEKSKYMVNARKIGSYQGVNYLECEGKKYERVKDFKYLGSQITQQNEIQAEIRARITVGNRCYYALQRVLRSPFVNRKLKLLVYKTIIRPAVLYGSETWTMRKSDELLLRVWERKVLRKIYGAVCENGFWRILTNKELYDKYSELDIVTVIRIKRIQWLGHVERMEPHRITRRLYREKPSNTRARGRPRTRWGDQVTQDLSSLGVTNWKQKAVNRVEWRKILKEAKALQGLSSQ